MNHHPVRCTPRLCISRYSNTQRQSCMEYRQLGRACCLCIRCQSSGEQGWAGCRTLSKHRKRCSHRLGIHPLLHICFGRHSIGLRELTSTVHLIVVAESQYRHHPGNDHLPCRGLRQSRTGPRWPGWPCRRPSLGYTPLGCTGCSGPSSPLASPAGRRRSDRSRSRYRGCRRHSRPSGTPHSRSSRWGN
jgi:hypothetical protein